MSLQLSMSKILLIYLNLRRSVCNRQNKLQMTNPTSKSARLTTTLDELAQLEIQTPNTPATSRATMNEDFLAQLDRMRHLSLLENRNRALPLTAQQIQQLSPFMTSVPVHRPQGAEGSWGGDQPEFRSAEAACNSTCQELTTTCAKKVM
ncbi:uncharacterized protein MYCGRDRAFT_82649, partial [Zymoseptoria tritici IPO323]